MFTLQDLEAHRRHGGTEDVPERTKHNTRSFWHKEDPGLAYSVMSCPECAYIWGAGCHRQTAEEDQAKYGIPCSELEGEAPGWVVESFVNHYGFNPEHLDRLNDDNDLTVAMIVVP